MTEATTINVVKNDTEVIVTGTGLLDLSNTKEFGSDLESFSNSAESVVVDFRECEFIDSAVVQYLANAAVNLYHRGKNLKLCVTEGSYPLRVLRIVGLDQINSVQIAVEQ